MKSKIKSRFDKLLTLAGFHVFIFTLGISNPLMIITCLLMTAVLFFKLKYKKDYLNLLFPLSAGLLYFLMKLFYWDRADLTGRLENLLLLALLFSLVMTIAKFRLLKKFLFFFNRLPLKKRLTGIFVFTEIVFIISSFILVRQGLTLGGDEPHYLVVSHSIARDLDVNVFNQYARDEYRDIIDVGLQHHARRGIGFKVWYSYGHLPGLSLTLAPFFIFKIPPPLLYFLIRSYLGLFGALLAVLVYLFALKLWRRAGLAIFICAVFTFTVPVFFYSLHIYAELQAALLVLASLYVLLFSSPPVAKHKKILLAGFLLGISVFWGLKYTIFIVLFSAGFFFYFAIKKRNIKKAVLFVLFPFIFQLLFFGFLYYAYGNFNPMSIYTGVLTAEQAKEYQNSVEQIPLQKRIETLLGNFFDQRDGLLWYNPFYFLFFPGLILALKKFKTYLPHLLISSAAFAYILFIGYSTVRAGYCPQARYLVPALWVLMMFAVIYYRETKNRFMKKIAFYLPLYSIFVVIYQVLHPFTLYQSATHDSLYRPGLMFQQWSSLHISLPHLLPSFVKVPGNFKYLPNLIFLALFLAFILFSLIPAAQGPSKKIKMPLLFVLLFVVTALFPRIPTYNPIVLGEGGENLPEIYGKSFYPTQAKERKFELVQKKKHSFTISMKEPVPYFVLELENNEKNGPQYNVSILNFDRQVKTIPIPPGTVQKISIKNPRYKSFKNKCFYRFHINIQPSPPAKPSLYIQLHPSTRGAHFEKTAPLDPPQKLLTR